jgi:hypothetical protein
MTYANGELTINTQYLYGICRFGRNFNSICVSHLHCSYGSSIIQWLQRNNFVVKNITISSKTLIKQ